MPELLCQECKGYGRVTEDVLDGVARRELCGWCNGTGTVTPEIRGIWLNYQKDLKRGKIR